MSGSAAPPEKQCYLLLASDSAASAQKEGDLIRQLESKDIDTKIATLKAIIVNLLNGEQYPKLLMPVIKFCLNSDNHTIKKLLLLYWEVVDKKNKDGHMLHEMILVCNAIKNDLNHPNEYLRGSTLRFLCKMKEAEILESLIPSITANLDHRHSYVRKNAVLTVFTVYQAFPELIPDAPELMEKFLFQEANPSAKKNAFLMLFHCDQQRAVNFLNTVANTISSLGESFQLVILELIRKVCRANRHVTSQYIRCIHNLVTSNSHSVAFEAANTLVALSSTPVAVKAAVSAYCQLLAAESDNNIKLIILGRLADMRRRNEKILQEMLMDILRSLSSPNIDIRKKTLDLAMELVNARNVDEVVNLLKKELVKTEIPDAGKSDAYRKLLVDAMHQCAVKFPDVVSNVVHLLMNYLGDDNASSAMDVIFFVREIVEEYSHLRDAILRKLCENFSQIRNSGVYRVALWILGEYATDSASLELALLTVRDAVGELPLLAPKTDENGDEKEKKADTKEEKPLPSAAASGKGAAASVPAKKGPVLNADGTYASQSAATFAKPEEKKGATGGASPATAAAKTTNLRGLLLDGDFFLAASLGNTMTKLALRSGAASGFGGQESNETIANALLMLVSILRLGTATNTAKPVDPDSLGRIMLCIRVLLEPKPSMEAFQSQTREVFAAMLQDQRKRQPKEDKKSLEVVRQADDLIQIRQLRGRMAQDMDLIDEDEADLSKALGAKLRADALNSKLNRVYQLTGFADPVYAEAQLTVLDYDIVMDMLIINQTSSILQNLAVELHTSGDLKVVERPQTFTIPPNGVQRVTANIKVTSTESGVIFGNIVYDSASGTQKNVVVMSNIHMDIMDYITPASCSDTQFRSMWQEFEWENKVAVTTDIQDLNQYLEHILKITNMRCMTPQAALSGSCNFLAANLYARSMFGEDALLNLSVEKQKTGKIGGYIRIRSKTQGIALSLGDKITAKQRVAK